MTREQITLRSAIASLTINARRIIAGLRSGGHVSTRAGASVEFDRYRAYQPGDDLRHLDWRVFARSDRLVLKRARLETTLDVLFMIDASGSMSFSSGGKWGSKFELVTAIAQALAWLAVESGDRISACSCIENDTKLCSFRAGGAGLAQVNKLLVSPAVSGRRLKLDVAAGVITAATQRPGLIVLLSDLLDPPEHFQRSIGQFRHAGHDVLVIQVLDRSERLFDVPDEVRFEDLEGGHHRRLHTKAVREDYLNALSTHQNTILTTCRELHVDHILVDPHESPIGLLRSILQHRSGGSGSSRQTG